MSSVTKSSFIRIESTKECMLARVLTQFSFNNSPIILLFYDFVFLLIENNVANEIPNVNIHNINFVPGNTKYFASDRFTGWECI